MAFTKCICNQFNRAKKSNTCVLAIVTQKRMCNLGEQKKLIRPLLQLFKEYQMLVLGDREFHSIKLANWLHSKGIDFVLCQKKRYLYSARKPITPTLTIFGNITLIVLQMQLQHLSCEVVLKRCLKIVRLGGIISNLPMLMVNG